MTWGYVLYGYLLLPALALAYVMVAAWAALKVSSKLKWWLAKLSAAVITALVFLVVPTGDAFVGRMKFTNLCESSAGIHVFRTVHLDAKHLRNDGSPKKELLLGRSEYKIADQYVVGFSDEEVLHWPRITRFRTEIRDTKQDEVLGEVINFHYWGGWLANQLPMHRSAESCPQVNNQTSLDRAVFRPLS